jgi:transposase
MPAKRLSMRRIRELLRLKAAGGMSDRALAQQIGVARSTMAEYLERLKTAGLAWPLPDDVTDAVLEQRLFERAGVRPGVRRHKEPDWAHLAREMRRPGVNLLILWEEYRQAEPGGYGYSRFCELYREFERRLTPTMRQYHLAGDKVFVDFSGKKVPIVDPITGEVKEAELFVAVLGASNFTYAEACWTQALPDWIGAHVRMLEFIGGVPRLVVPDNLKAGVHKASFYDPEINRTYARLAAHYGFSVLPTRPAKPKDKAKVEAGVRFAQTYILGRLRNLTFYSLAEANAAIRAMLERLNGHVMRRLGVNRQHLFATVERPALNSLPPTPYEYAEWKLARVGLDYHVEIEQFSYSVPYALIRQQVDGRLTARTVEIYPRRPARRRPCPPLWRPPTWHRPRPHAEPPPGICPVVARAVSARGQHVRAEHGGPVHRHPGAAASPRARVPQLPGHCAAVPRRRRDARRSCLGPCSGDRRAQLQEHRLHPGQQPRP